MSVLPFGDNFVRFLEVAQHSLSVPDGYACHVGDACH
jgi:hypothetical protein